MKVIDISKHQGAVDFSKAKQNGVGAVMLRASYGSYKDSRLDEFTKNCILPYGVYTFSTWHYDESSLKNAMVKIDFELGKLLTYLKDKNFSKIVAVDMELEHGHTIKLSKAELTQAVNYYCDNLKKAGYKPLVYCSASWLTDKFVKDDIKYPWWIAYYNNAGFKSDKFPNNKYGNEMLSVKDKVALWQYSSNGDGTSYGVSSQRVDLDHAYKLFSDMLGSSSKPKQQPQNPPLQSNAIKVGSIVKVRRDAKTYDNKPIASFVYDKAYRVDELKGKRAVLNKKGICTPVNVNDLYVVGSAPTPKPVKQPVKPVCVTYVVKKGDSLSKIATRYKISTNTIEKANPQIKNKNLIYAGQVINVPTGYVETSKPIKVGSKVRVKKGAKTYDNGPIASFVFDNTYRVDQLKGNRAVLGLKTICTPVNTRDLEVV